ncbi:lipid II:glycine glycyltransferase FemX [Methanoplanus limicola]|uniref:BioF2-like acetyltransferase domain-containing protein n=1 Tax=Methanoplanus limicola DSM 2279 TaxID=937775 RepID=H1Z4E0_9EURY|nr:GNAT family N-acetyltransferase [Methanoplanus limicola]EHQ36688.1 hypothetical protein Metlim_2647 [Methanoplanus limicola DSM 2279]
MRKILRQIPENEWRKYINCCSNATIYHTPEWKTFLEKTFGYKPYYIFATDEYGQLAGMLPQFHVKSILTGNRLCSVPFSHECGCLGDNYICTALTNEAINLNRQLNIGKIEIRDSINNSVFEGKSTFCTHKIELSQNLDEIWKKMDKGSVRWAVNKAKKLGVKVNSSINIEDLKEFYELNCITKHNLGVPCHPWDFFKNLFDFLEGHVKMYLSEYNGNIIGGGIMLYYKDKVIYGYGAANPDYLKLYPYNAFIWKSIEDACINGYQMYDFGRTSYDNTGLIKFKERWGTQEKKLWYSYYPKYTNSSLKDRNSGYSQFANKAVRVIPMPIYKAFSKSIFSHLG